MVEWARARGIRTIALVSYTPGWAQPRDCRDTKCAPADVGDYARFLKQLVAHFSPLGVKHYEIWNEPNQYFWWKPKPSPARYASLLRAAYPAAKSVDRSITIIAGAFAPTYDSPDGRYIRSTTYVQAPLRQRRPWLLRRHLDPPVLGRLPARRRRRLEHDDRGHAGHLRHDASAR